MLSWGFMFEHSTVLFLKGLSVLFSQTTELCDSCPESSSVPLTFLLLRRQQILLLDESIPLFYECIYLGKIINAHKQPEVGNGQL